MFRKRVESTYIKSINKIIVPGVHGERKEVIMKKKNYIAKFALVASLTAVCLIGGFTINGPETNSENDINRNKFCVVAQAADNKEINLEKNKMVKLDEEASKFVKKDLSIKGENIKMVNLSSEVGDIFNSSVSNNTDIKIGYGAKNGTDEEIIRSKSIELVKDTNESIEFTWNAPLNIMDKVINDKIEQENVDEINVKITYEDGSIENSKIKMSIDADGMISAQLV